MRRRRFVLGSTTAALMAFMYLPLLVVVLFAFNAGANLSWPPQGLSLRWFRLISGEDAFVSGLLTSVRAAAFTAAVAGIVGTTAAFAFVRRPSRFMRWLETGSRLPVMLPPLFMGIALAVAMKTFSIDPSLLTITAGHVVATTPFVILIVAARLRNYDVAIEQAARDLGASPPMVLRRITLPLIAPSVIGAMVIAAAISFDEVLITTFTSGIQQTLPLFVLSRLRRTIDPSINAVATILLVVPWVAVVAAYLSQRRRSVSEGIGGLA